MITPHLKLELIKRKYPNVNVKEFQIFNFGGTSKINIEDEISKKLTFFDEYKDRDVHNIEYRNMINKLNEFTV